MKKSLLNFLHQFIIVCLVVSSINVLPILAVNAQSSLDINTIESSKSHSGGKSYDVYGDYIVSVDSRHGITTSNEEIYLYNMVTGEERRLTNNPHMQANPAIYENNVVWIDAREGRSNIHLYNIATGTETVLPNERNVDRWGVDITEQYIVWVEYVGGTQYICSYDMWNENENCFSLSTTWSIQGPSVSGDIVVWADIRNGDYDIFSYNLKTFEEIPITTNRHPQYEPVITGDKVVWYDYRDANYDIYMYDFSEDKESQITNDIGLEYNPAVSEQYISWYSTDGNIYVKNLLTGEVIFQHLQTFTYGTPVTPTIFENKLVWTDNFKINYVVLPELNVEVAKPVIKHDVYDDTKQLSGKADPYNQVVVKTGSQTLASGMSDGMGRFTLSISPQTGGTELTLHTENKFGKRSENLIVPVLDVTAPIITGVEKDIYNEPVYINFNEGTASLNGVIKSNPFSVTEFGKYELIVTDRFGNTSKKVFEIDYEAPLVEGVEHDNAYKSAKISFTEGTATLNGKAINSPYEVIDEGEYTIQVVDKAGNATRKRFTIDRTSPVIEDLVNFKHYQAKSIWFNEGAAYLNGTRIQLGYEVTVEGEHTLKVIDDAGNETERNFVIDRSSPIITGIENNQSYQSVTLVFNEGEAVLNGDKVSFGQKVTAPGNYYLVITDKANNKSTREFSIKSFEPDVKGMKDGGVYNQDLQIEFEGVIAKLNGMLYPSGTKIDKDGTYHFEVSNETGDSKHYYFTIDKISPHIIGVESNRVYKESVTPLFNEGTATLNGNQYLSGTPIVEDGHYTLILKDKAENQTEVSFEIDSTPVYVNGVENQKTYNEEVKIQFMEGVGRLNGFAYESGTIIEKDGDYDFEVSDDAGNITSYRFKIDRNPPIVFGAENLKKYSMPIKLYFTEGTGVLNGRPYYSGSEIQSHGDYILIVKDEAGNETKLQFAIDLVPPLIEGVEKPFSNKSVTPIFYGEGLLNGISFVSGTSIRKEGKYTLVVKDEAGNKAIENFEIDTTVPEIKGVEDKVYGSSVLPEFDEERAYLNEQLFISGTRIDKDGTYSLKVIDLAGNEKTVNFVLDLTSPEITGVTSGHYKKSVKPEFSEGVAQLNGKSFTSGTTISAEGHYTLEVTDAVGNKTSVQFWIDYSPVEILGVENNKIYNHIVTPNFNEGVAILNGQRYLSGTPIEKDGSYYLSINDGNDNEAVVYFVVDTKSPIIYNVSQKQYNRPVIPFFTEGTATLNGQRFSSGTEITEDGQYELTLMDDAGNISKVTFSLDQTPPVIQGIDKELTNQVVIPLFDGAATLNGQAFNSGTLISVDGSYLIKVIDGHGNQSSKSFVIDRTKPIIKGLDKSVYKDDVEPSFNEGTATLNGKPYVSGATVSKEGTYELIVTDGAGNVSTTKFNIDRTPPSISGVTSKSYSEYVRPTFSEGTATLNGHAFVSGTEIKKDSSYTLVVTDKAGNQTQIDFNIDTEAPVIEGVSNQSYRHSVTPVFSEGDAFLNGLPFKQGLTISAEGFYELIVKDGAGNESKVVFTIDTTSPKIQDVENKTYFSKIVPKFNEGNATLNGKPFKSGTEVSEEGQYELKVTDAAGNTSTVNFKLDMTPVDIIGVVNEGIYNRAVAPTFNKGTARLNGKVFLSGQQINKDGSYVLEVTDTSGRSSVVAFKIDQTAPVVHNLASKAYSHKVQPFFTEVKATLNGIAFKSGAFIEIEGNHELIVEDDAGNKTAVRFAIDFSAPIVTGVKNNTVTNKSVTLDWNEGIAKLNGNMLSKPAQITESGSYRLEVEDSVGNQTTISFVIDKKAPSKPTLNTLTNKSTVVSGKAEANSSVQINYAGKLYVTKANELGVYEYKLQTSLPGSTVAVQAKDAAGNVSSSVSLKVLNTFSTFTVNSVKSTATTMTGKGNKGATVQAYVGTKLIGKTAKVDSKGNYKLTVSRQKPGVVVTVKMTQSGYQEMKKTTRVVK
ncbi:Ig-like domain-containing protein [Exiguobacterium sp. s50]|uniref:Ig-like domain-containing protein n=1 Tax=Exiguobacterium sp. s50 TaxID=2751234 RepID=UPI001BE50D89|nr:Ig-like domain-containing protein [Exiguobacterium sp. s50]